MPALFQNDVDNTSRQIRKLTQVDNSGTVRELKQLWQNDSSGNPKLIYAAFSGSAGVTVTPSNVYGRVNSRATLPITTGPATGTINSGTGPFSIQWIVSSGWTALQPASLTASFRSPPVPPGGEDSGTASLRVTDSFGMVADSNVVEITATNDGFL